MLNLTSQERKALLLLAFLLILGATLKYFIKASTYPSTFRGLEEDSRQDRKTININTASRQELTQIPGIGPVIADRIISWRNQNGSFQDVEELKKIKGIGDKKLETIKASIRLD